MTVVHYAKMIIRFRPFQLILWCLLLCIAVSVFLSFSLANFDGRQPCDCPGRSSINWTPNSLHHRLCIIVPFRDRFHELTEFAPHMQSFLRRQSIDFDIFVVNQVDGFRFNRASLINVGFLVSQDKCDYIAMHDVDLFPANDYLSYAYPSDGVAFHVSSPELHPRYSFDTFIGGILLMTRKDFSRVNGMSNNYWGWGLEDDEFRARLKEGKIEIRRPQNVGTDRKRTFKHFHNPRGSNRKRDEMKCYNQREVTRKRDRLTGLNTVKYRINSQRRVAIDESAVVLVNVELECDKVATPWCNCTGAKYQPYKKLPRDEDVIAPMLKKSDVHRSM